MAVFIVSYDLMAPESDYKLLYARLAGWHAVHAINSIWLVDADVTSAALRDDLRAYVHANDRLFVAALAGPSAWTVLMPGAGDFLQARFGVG
jgi:hypothetical protein